MTATTDTDRVAAALDYLTRGWQPIPVPPATKNPNRRGWQHERRDAAAVRRDFSGRQMNIGVLLGEPSDGLVDVDLDAPEARVLAEHFLPPTGSRFGRPGSPGAHWFYRADPLVPTKAYTDPAPPTGDATRARLVELRATGAQTIVPPSTHPSGERIAWEQDGDPAVVDGRELAEQLARLAAAALLARHWPEPGSRHDAALALAGGLLRGGWDVEMVADFIEAVAAAASDEEAADRGRNAATTARRLASDGTATGWPRLAQLIPTAVVDTVRMWLGIRTDDGVRIIFGDDDRDEPTPHTRDWPEPADPAAFYGIAGEIANTLDPYTEADPVALLTTTLGAAGNIMGPGPHWSVSGTRHGLRLDIVQVGPTAKGRKGTSVGSVMPIFNVAAPEWSARCVVSGLSSGEGLIWAVRDPIIKTEPVKEHGRVVDYQEVTDDPGVVDKRLLVIEQEFASVLKLMTREGNILSTVIRQAWDDGNLRTLTKNTPARATNAHISILGHITQDELLRHLDDTEAANGFANRFIWVCVRRSKLLPSGGEPDPLVVQTLGERLGDALAKASTIGRITRDAEADELWEAVYGPLSDGGVGLLGAVLGRAEAQVLRLAAIYAALDGSSLIRVPHLRAALALWEYAERSAEFIFGDTLGDPVADTILSALRQSGPLSRNDVVDLFGRNLSRARLDRALGTLLAAGKTRRWMDHETGGRPREMWAAA